MVPVAHLPNSGIVTFYQMRWLFSWLFLIPIILVEGVIIAWGLKTAFFKALGAALANIASTLVGLAAAIAGVFTLINFTELLKLPIAQMFRPDAGPLGEIAVDLAIAVALQDSVELINFRKDGITGHPRLSHRGCPMKLKFLEEPPLKPEWMTCPHCGGRHIGIHSRSERRYICHTCHRTFAETQGTPLFGLKYPVWLVVVVLTLLAHGCPVQAITAAFYLDARTVTDWLRKAGLHGKKIQERVVCNGRVTLGQVQADELYVKMQGGRVWMATAMSVFSRLFLWGEVALQRDRRLIERVVAQVWAAAGGMVQPVLFAVDGLSAYPRAILKYFHTKLYTGKPGRPRHLPWPDLHIVQVVKEYSGRKLREVKRHLVHGCPKRVDELVALTQTWLGRINTAYIERLNATFRALLPSLARRTRNLARTVERLEWEMFWCGVVYNFCTVHTTLEGTPAMAADLTDHVWSVRELLLFRPPPPEPLHAVL